MNNELLSQLSPEDQVVSEALQSKAQSIQIDTLFQASLEAQLKQAHTNQTLSAQGPRFKLLPALGWAIVAIGALFLLNWTVRSLAPDLQPAAHGTPNSDATPNSTENSGNLCAGQLALAHGFSVFIINQDKSDLIEFDKEKNIGELRSFALSPDGSQLAIVGNSGNIYLADTTGPQLHPILSHSELGYLMGVTWSHDGDRLLTWDIENNKRVYLLNKDGSGLNEIDLPSLFFETPQFAPDDESILFYGADSSSSGLFQQMLDGSPVKVISELVEDQTSFAWSPDGTRLAFIEMDREVGEARLVIEGQGTRESIATLPIPKGSGSSIPNSANLSWSLDGTHLVFEFGYYASDRTVYLANADGSGLVPLAESAHAPAISANGKCLAYVSGKQVYLLDLSVPSPTPVLLSDLPAGRAVADFQLDKLEWSAEITSTPDIPTRIEATPTPSGEEYDWHGIKLYLNAPLPDIPVEANLYQLNPEQPATLESARALAQQFGIAGEIYLAPGEVPGTTNYLVTDGKQRLYVRSDRYFTYYVDYANYSIDMFSYQAPLGDKAQSFIDEFLKSHGFDFAYQVESAPQIVNSYYIVPLSPDGFPLRFDYLMPVRLEIKLDTSGQVIFVQSGLVNYQQAGTYGLRTAEEAWQKVLNDTSGAGMQEGIRGGGILEEYYWQRTYPEDQPVTLYGRLTYYPPAETGGAPFASIGDYTITGNLAGMDALEGNAVVEANGSFSTENGVRTFKVDSWKVNQGTESSLMGTLKRDGDQAIMLNYDGNQYLLEDIPADAPFDTQSGQGEVNVSGVLANGHFEWSLIQFIPANSMGGGGGGGGGLGFYKLNLSGTPVPLPTAEVGPAVQGTGEYTVQEGDSLGAIATVYGITVDQLMQLNGLNDATIFIGQKLVVPGAPEPSPVGQKIEGQRGIAMVEIYRQTNGSLQTIYRLLSPPSSQYNYFQLTGDGLEELEKYHNRPIDIWGTVESADSNHGIVVHVDRYEVPFPDLQFQILRGTQEQVTLDGQEAILFTTNGQTYVQSSLDGNVDRSVVGNPGDEVLAEALILPGETFGGYPAFRVYSLAMAISPKNGQPMDMQVTADKPFVIDGPVPSEQNAAPPTATLEKVELVYYTTDPRYKMPDSPSEPAYLQPVWRFSGHFSSGDEFEVLVQALKDEFLLPEVETVQPPG